MAIAPRDLYTIQTLRQPKKYFPTHARTVVFAEDTTITAGDTDKIVSAANPLGDTWPQMTPCYHDGTFWRIWNRIQPSTDPAIEGFVIGATGHSTANNHGGVSGLLQLKVGDEVQGVIMLTGDVDYFDIFDPELEKKYIQETIDAAGTINPDLITALNIGPREKGIHIINLESAR